MSKHADKFALFGSRVTRSFTTPPALVMAAGRTGGSPIPCARRKPVQGPGFSKIKYEFKHNKYYFFLGGVVVSWLFFMGFGNFPRP